MRRLAVLLALGLVALVGASPALGARVVTGSVEPSSFRGKPTVVMFLHPF
jgi:hypothetical protein